MRIGLVAHDDCKGALLEWCAWNKPVLARHELFATGTTGSIIEAETHLSVTRLLSGPKGGDQQIGAMIATQKLDALFFFWDPESPQPHDPDVKALLRLATLWNVPYACNTATADMIISSPLFEGDYEPLKPDFDPRTVEVVDGEVVITDSRDQE
ncbi:MAG: methylglyoxal synthase [Propionibacteriaceae bacterium]|jgi:methylglyoxal synthase|nr:methylglyoxal synthase [Propionibacteriaceae bacterium]